MSAESPIPEATFARAVERLDAESLAAFVGAIRAETADAVTVDPPLVTVRDDGVRIDLLVAPDGAELPADVDVVVTADPPANSERRVVTPADLRRRVLYGLPPQAADALCERHLGVPARGEYDVATPERAGVADTADGGTSSEGVATPGPGGGGRSGEETADDRSDPDPAPTTLRDRRQVVATAVGLLVAVVVAVGGGSRQFAGGGSSPAVGDAGGASTPGPTVAATATPRAGDASGNRNVGLEPTCTRSPLLVVQIQLNALKHNDDETNDGIRTARRFASPENRRAVGSLEEFVRVVESETYAPLLSWERVEYTPRRVDARTATVRVVTAASGEVTGRYEFRLGKQDGGVYDGCWMTESVRSLTVDRTG